MSFAPRPSAADETARGCSPEREADSQRCTSSRRTGRRSNGAAHSSRSRCAGDRRSGSQVTRPADTRRRGAIRTRVRGRRPERRNAMSAVARRYAKALFGLGREAGDFETLGRDLATLARAFADPAVARLIDHATLDGRTRRAMVSRVSTQIGLSRLLANFLAVLAVNNRLRELGTIDREYQRLEDRALGRVRARVRSARPLPDESRRRINEVFERRPASRSSRKSERIRRYSGVSSSKSQDASSTAVCAIASSGSSALWPADDLRKRKVSDGDSSIGDQRDPEAADQRLR